MLMHRQAPIAVGALAACAAVATGAVLLRSQILSFGSAVPGGREVRQAPDVAIPHAFVAPFADGGGAQSLRAALSRGDVGRGGGAVAGLGALAAGSPAGAGALLPPSVRVTLPSLKPRPSTASPAGSPSASATGPTSSGSGSVPLSPYDGQQSTGGNAPASTPSGGGAGGKGGSSGTSGGSGSGSGSRGPSVFTPTGLAPRGTEVTPASSAPAAAPEPTVAAVVDTPATDDGKTPAPDPDTASTTPPADSTPPAEDPPPASTPDPADPSTPSPTPADPPPTTTAPDPTPADPAPPADTPPATAAPAADAGV